LCFMWQNIFFRLLFSRKVAKPAKKNILSVLASWRET
jgi:hypothetical protein